MIKMLTMMLSAITLPADRGFHSQVVELDVQGPLELCYDPEWLAVLRSTHHLMSTNKAAAPLPANWGGRAGGAHVLLQRLESFSGSLLLAGAMCPFCSEGSATHPCNIRPEVHPHNMCCMLCHNIFTLFYLLWNAFHGGLAGNRIMLSMGKTHGTCCTKYLSKCVYIQA